MAYTPATQLPTLTYAQWSRPGATAANPRISAPSNIGMSTIGFSTPLLDHTGTAPVLGCLVGIRDSVTSYVLHVYVPPGGFDATGTVASGCIRGIRLEGLDYTTSDPTLDIDLGPDSSAFLEVDPVVFNLMIQAMKGTIASGGTSWRIGNLTDVDIKVAAANGDVNEPFFEYNSATNQWVFSNNGTSSTPFGTGAGVTAGSGITVSAGVISVNLADTTDFVLSSSGASDNGKVARLNASGQYPAGFINALSASIVTTKGDLIAATGNAAIAREGVGSNGQVYIADSTVVTGHRWGQVPLGSGNYAANFNNSRVGDSPSGTQVIAHGLGTTPGRTKITANWIDTLGGVVSLAHSVGTYNGSVTACVASLFSNAPAGVLADSNTNMIILMDRNGVVVQVATITVDATNITLNWTLTGSPGATGIEFLWEVEG